MCSREGRGVERVDKSVLRVRKAEEQGREGKGCMLLALGLVWASLG